MLMPPAAVTFQDFFFHAAMLPAVGGAFAGMALALFRKPGSPFRNRESESLMNFSSLGRLRCICGTSCSRQAETDRREFCRSCGCEVLPVNHALLDRQLSQTEMRQLTRELRTAARRASRLELPGSITSIAELQTYIATDAAKTFRSALSNPPATAKEQPQVPSRV